MNNYNNEWKYLDMVSKWMRVERKRLKNQKDGMFYFNPIPKPVNCWMNMEENAEYYPTTYHKLIRQECHWCGRKSKIATHHRESYVHGE